jgi:hypothetical protein
MSKQKSLPRTVDTFNPEMQDRDADTHAHDEMSRRRFLKSSAAGLAAGAVATGTALPGNP